MELLLQPRGNARHLAHELALDALHVHVAHGLRALAQLELLRLETQLDQLLPRICQRLLRLRRREGSGVGIGPHACLGPHLMREAIREAISEGSGVGIGPHAGLGPHHLEVREICLGEVLQRLLILLEHRHHALVARVCLGRDLGCDLARQQAATPAAADAPAATGSAWKRNRLGVR